MYDDINLLRDFGMDILRYQDGNQYYYHIGSREFELPELKLLVDSVQSSKFITEKKSRELIKKLESLVSKYEAGQLNSQVVIAGRIKSMNESVYYNVDSIHDAINENRKIRFQYFNWTPDKERELRHGGGWYVVSPICLMWDDENYYLVSYALESELPSDTVVANESIDSQSTDDLAAVTGNGADDKETATPKGRIMHFRVDKMLNISMTDEKRAAEAEKNSFDVSAYARKVFGMFSGESVRVSLECENAMAGVMIDRFGKDAIMQRTDDEHFAYLCGGRIE